VLAEARAAWPDIVLDDAAFRAFIGDDDPATLDLPVLYLACACVRGDERALATFEQRYLAALPDYLARITTDPAIVDDIRQQLRIKLFVPDDGGVAKIARYRRGSLPAWLAIDVMRKRDVPLAPLSDSAIEQGALDDPRLALLKETYRTQVSRAFAASLAELSAADRALLRLCFLDELDLAAIGKIYQLSKSAVSRRLSACRDRLLADVKRRLREELGVVEAELDSIMRLVTSQLHFSLPRLLG
jgi:RNA polymerase sigma-70 factor, ECF subfamily